MSKISILEIDLGKKNPLVLLSDERKVTVPLELIVKYKIKEGNDLHESDLEEVLYESEKWLCKDAGLKYLNNKNKTAYEMEKHLEEKGFSYDVIEDILFFMKENLFVDDDSFVESFVANSITKGKGSLFIEEQLSQKGVSNDLVTKYLDRYSEEETEYDRCKRYAEKYLKHETISNKMIMKLSRKLFGLGYPQDIIGDVLEQYVQVDGFDNE